MAKLALTVVGYGVGFMVGGPLGASIGGAIGGYVGAMVTAEDVKGPRLDELGVAGGEEGAPINQLYGTSRMTGHVIVSDDLVEHEHEEDMSGKGGPTYTTYTYTLTYAVAFCEPRLGAGVLRRVWSNKKLYEDYTETADATAENIPMVWYDGTQTEPDAELVSLIGEGNVPAYTGIAYGMYRDRAMEDFGNRAPVDEAEIVSNGSASPSLATADFFADARRTYSTESVFYSELTGKCYTVVSDNTNAFISEFSPFSKVVTRTVQLTNSVSRDFRLVSGSGSYQTKNRLAVLDSSTVLKIFSLTNGLTLLDSWAVTSASKVLAETAHWIFLGAGGTQRRLTRKDGGLNVNINAAPFGLGSFEDAVFGLANNRFLIQFDPGNEFGVCQVDYDGTITIINTETNSGYTSITSGFNGIVEDRNGDLWTPVIAGGTSQLIRLNKDGVIQEMIDVEGDYGANDFILCGNWILDYDPDRHCLYWGAHTNRIERFFIDELRLESYAFDTLSYLGASGLCGLIWHAPTDRVIVPVAVSTQDHEWGIVRLRTVAAGTLDLADVVSDVCGQVGLAASEIDVTGFTGSIVGYLNGRQGPASGVIDQCMRLGLATYTSSDWKLVFTDLGGASALTIDANDLGAREFGTPPKTPVETTERPYYRVPKRWQIRYSGSENNQENSMVLVENPIGSSELTGGEEYPASMTQQQASDLCQKQLLLNGDKKPYSFSLPRPYGKLDPGDVVTLPTNQGNKRVRLLNVDRGANGILEISAISDNASDLTAVTTPPAPIDNDLIEQVGPAQLIYLDTPLLRDADNGAGPGPYVCAFSEGTGWLGAQILNSADNQSFTVMGGLATESKAGICATVPSTIDFEDWDDTNTIRVRLLTSGILASATDNNLLYNRGNVAAWGVPGRWEIVQFGTVALVSGSTYDLSHLLRGRRGTDIHMDSHQENDWFIILDEASTLREVVGQDLIGTDRYYKAVNYGSYASDAPSLEYTLGNTPLLPWTPNAISAADNGTDPADIDFTWDWRTRWGGTYGGANSVTDGVPGTQQDETTGKIRFLDVNGNVLNTYNTTADSYTYDDVDRLSDYTGLSGYAVYYQIAQDASTAGITNGMWSLTKTYVLGFAVLDADGNSFLVGRDVLNSAGTSFTVSRNVLNSAGSSFAV